MICSLRISVAAWGTFSAIWTSLSGIRSSRPWFRVISGWHPSSTTIFRQLAASLFLKTPGSFRRFLWGSVCILPGSMLSLFHRFLNLFQESSLLRTYLFRGFSVHDPAAILFAVNTLLQSDIDSTWVNFLRWYHHNTSDIELIPGGFLILVSNW